MQDADISSLSRQLEAAYARQFVCGPATDLVVEGYPRSSNTFTVDFLSILARRGGRAMQFAHHTHDARNVQLGCALGIPTVVLLREPVDAISSYMIYSGLPVAAAVSRYVEFYAAVRPLRARLLIARFDRLTADFNGFVAALNDRFGFGLPLSEDPEADAEAAKDLERGRGEKMYKGEAYAARVAVPNAARSEMARGVKAEVADFLERRPQARNLHITLAGA